MAQSILTVTPENPTPPTNLSSIGVTPPNPATYDPLVYSAPVANPPPVFDDGYTFPEPNGKVFATQHALVNVSTGLTSVPHEGAGTEVAVTQSYNAMTFNPAGALVTVSTGPAITPGVLVTPNASHPSTLSGSAVPTLTGASGASNVSGTGTTLFTATGTNFNRASIVNINGVPQPTNYVSATSLTVTNAQKKATSGNLPVTVTSNGITTAVTNWVFT
jgi:hypothetical protein